MTKSQNITEIRESPRLQNRCTCPGKLTQSSQKMMWLMLTYALFYCLLTELETFKNKQDRKNES